VILAFDTSGPWCAACLLSGDDVLAAVEEPMARGQAERLMPMLAEMLEGAGLDWSHLAAIAAGTGPGTFTGTRVAVAAARGLALARGIPAIGVTALEAAALHTPGATTVAASGPGWFGLREPGAEPRLVAEADLPPGVVGWIPGATVPPEPLAVAIARVAASRLGEPRPRPAPLYLRPPDAAPPRLAAPPIAER
jgi:tRNA A37 threonylcarbamoyladenosine modification protein TsaB